VPVAQLFSWLRREHRVETNPAADLLLPRPDRRLPEATLSAQEMAMLLRTPDVSKPLGLRDRAVLEVFYSCGLRRAELVSLRLRDSDSRWPLIGSHCPGPVRAPATGDRRKGERRPRCSCWKGDITIERPPQSPEGRPRLTPTVFVACQIRVTPLGQTVS